MIIFSDFYNCYGYMIRISNREIPEKLINTVKNERKDSIRQQNIKKMEGLQRIDQKTAMADGQRARAAVFQRL